MNLTELANDCFGGTLSNFFESLPTMSLSSLKLRYDRFMDYRYLVEETLCKVGKNKIKSVENDYLAYIENVFEGAISLKLSALDANVTFV